MWTNYFDDIVVFNLPSRTDRLLESMEQFEQYNIPVRRYEAIVDESNGAEGLRKTLVKYFTECVENKRQNVLVFEDDVLFKEDPNPIMDKVVTQIPIDYDCIFLGCQVTNSFVKAHSENLLLLRQAYSTHAVCYSLKAMKDILAMGITAPIDNWLASNFQNRNNSYAIRPLLATQRAGYSSIGHAWIDWDKFITPKFNEHLRNI